MTLRQLRQVASELGVTLYSRKTKAELMNAIGERQADISSVEQEHSPPPKTIDGTRVVFLPRDPQWAYVFWEISETDRQQAFKDGANQLCLRVADVTGVSDGGVHPHTLQEVPVDSHATEWYLPVPLSDRDYRVELGYRVNAGGWISLAYSSVARVPALHPSEQILDQFVPFSLDAPLGSSDAAGIAFLQQFCWQKGLSMGPFFAATGFLCMTIALLFLAFKRGCREVRCLAFGAFCSCLGIPY